MNRTLPLILTAALLLTACASAVPAQPAAATTSPDAAVCLLFLVLLRCFIGLFLQLINCLQFLVGKELVLGFVFAWNCHGIRWQKPVVNGDRCNGVLGASVDIRRCAAVRGVRHQRMGHDVKLVVADR